MTELKQTPLHQNHLKLKARMVPFGGWDMPVQYPAGLMKEHLAVRQDVGLFDVCHMGEFFISGAKAKDFLNRVTTNDVTKLENGQCQYTLLCYENGTVVDDLIISKVSDNKYWAIVNASNIDKDFSWLESNNNENVSLENLSQQKGLIAIQGPKSQQLLNKYFDQDFSELKYYNFKEIQHGDNKLIVFRTGYTGEDGFEVMPEADKASFYWDELLNAGKEYNVLPAGLGARDTLRLEAAYSLYGHEINDTILPLEAKLGWVVKLKDKDFIGKESLIKAKELGIKRKVIGFEMIDSGVCRDGYSIYANDQKIGSVTSGTYSPSLKKSIGLAIIDQKFANIDQELLIDIRNKKRKIKIVKTPFYKRANL
ncbi:glycine cleavage system protein T [bacterium K02(2017)]|nr:glycine cleavage system protein T [bacterium K02(2017)]